MKLSKNIVGLEPFNINEETKFLILGSFPSVKSLEGNFYYLHPQNKFYRIISEIFGEEFPTAIESKKELLIKHNIGLYDIVESCKREGSLDSNIKDIKIVNLYQFPNIENVKIGCTGKKSFELVQKNYPKIKAHYLSSPSPANNGNFDIVSWKDYFLGS